MVPSNPAATVDVAARHAGNLSGGIKPRDGVEMGTVKLMVRE